MCKLYSEGYFQCAEVFKKSFPSSEVSQKTWFLLLQYAHDLKTYMMRFSSYLVILSFSL